MKPTITFVFSPNDVCGGGAYYLDNTKIFGGAHEDQGEELEEILKALGVNYVERELLPVWDKWWWEDQGNDELPAKLSEIPFRKSWKPPK